MAVKSSIVKVDEALISTYLNDGGDEIVNGDSGSDDDRDECLEDAFKEAEESTGFGFIDRASDNA